MRCLCVQSLRQYKDAQKEAEVLLKALSDMQDKNMELENSLSAETRFKQDLFSALGEERRVIKVLQGKSLRWKVGLGSGELSSQRKVQLVLTSEVSIDRNSGTSHLHSLDVMIKVVWSGPDRPVLRPAFVFDLFLLLFSSVFCCCCCSFVCLLFVGEFSFLSWMGLFMAHIGQICQTLETRSGS